MTTLHFTVPAKRGDTIRVPAALMALIRDPGALDHVGTIDMDAVHRRDRVVFVVTTAANHFVGVYATREAAESKLTEPGGSGLSIVETRVGR